MSTEQDIDRVVAEKRQQLVDAFLAGEVTGGYFGGESSKVYSLKGAPLNDFYLCYSDGSETDRYSLTYGSYILAEDLLFTDPVVAKCREVDARKVVLQEIENKQRFIRAADKVLLSPPPGTRYTEATLGQFDVYEEVPKPKRWWEFWR